MAVIAVVLFGVAANFGRSEDGADGLGAFSALVVLKVEATVVCDLVKDPQELLGVGNIEPRNWKEKRYQLYDNNKFITIETRLNKMPHF